MELDELKLEFYMNNKYNKIYKMHIYYMDSDNYCIRLKDDKEELFSTYIDSDGCEVIGNAEIYTLDYINDVIQKCYEIYNFFVKNNMLTKGNRDE